MIRSFDFVQMAQKNRQLRNEIEMARSSSNRTVVYTYMHKLDFDSINKIVMVEPCSEEAHVQCKIVPKKITYKALICMLENRWDDMEEGDIVDIKPKPPVHFTPLLFVLLSY